MKDKSNKPAPEAAEKTAPGNNETPQTAAENAGEAPEKTGAAPDPVAELQGKLAEAQAKYLYLQAEYQNYRKRVAKDLSDTRALTTADTLSPFLTVFDYLSMAETAAEQSDNVDAIRQGLKMIIAEFFKAFDELNVKPFDAVGAKFDPELHDAVAKENSETVAEGTVIKQWCRGFKLGARLLRPARVVVSSGAAAGPCDKPEPEEAPADGERKQEK